jgi:hypothetical protein
MATTTNFGWETPDDTDLVKDGAAAMRTLGNSIDTSFVDLKGGTSGQMLTKASNTDLDYTWVTPEIGDITAITASSPLTGGGTTGAVTVGILDGTTSNKGAVQLSTSTSSTSTSLAATASAVKSAYDLADAAIPKSLIDAAGDLIVGTAADTAGRLAVGTAGQFLKVNSGATALEWGAGGSGALTYVGGASFSDSSSQSLNNVFSSTYSNYQILVAFDKSVSTGSPIMRLRSSGTDNSASNYYSACNFVQINGSESAGISKSSAVSSFVFNDAANLYNTFFMFNPQASAKTYMASTKNAFGYSTSFYMGDTTGLFNDTTSFDGLTISVTSGTMTGTIRVYGIANS